MPKKAPKAAAPQAARPLEGCTVALSGTFPGQSQSALHQLALQLGAATISSVTKDATHLIATQADFDKPSTKVKAARESGIHITSVEWLQDCLVSNSRKPETAYSLGTATSPAVHNGTSPQVNRSRKRNLTAIAADASGATGSAPGVATGASPAESEPRVKKKKTEDQKTWTDGQIAKSKDVQIPIDEGCTLTNYAVYIDPAGVIYDASLNQTNASNNNNKFYRIQLLYSAFGDYKTWTRWGRVGERGQTAVLGNGLLNDALRQFDKKFRDKCGHAWDDRGLDPRPGKYAFVERSYNADSDEEDNGSVDVKEKKPEWLQPPKSTLLPAVQDLMRLIFNQQFFAATMTQFNYDANKLPLGKLGKNTITRGFQALKDLSALLEDNTLATGYNMPFTKAREHLSNLYYSLIPHAFGRTRPPIIENQVMVKTETELLESLSDMKDAELIMKLERQGSDDVHPLDRQFQGLGMDELTPLRPDTTEFQLLVEYLTKSRAATHHVNYAVEQIFRIERGGERDRFEKSEFLSVPRDRRLLWHGSRCTNFGGILSQGLRIAPPEAPVSGYMFGKGIYLADMSSKSANYCYSITSNNTALLLLCEAELGNPIQALTHASFSAGEDAKAKGMYSTWGQGSTGPKQWKDARCVHPSLAGVMMPDVSVPPGPTCIPNAYLQYNEYICYDVAQVRLRYLFRVKM